MAVKMRLRREGKRKQPFYRVVVADVRSPRDGRFIEDIGYYQPLREPSEITIDRDRALYWLGQGVQPSDAVRQLLRVTGIWEEFRPGDRGRQRATAAPTPARASAAPQPAPEPAAHADAPAAEVDAPTTEADAPAAEADTPETADADTPTGAADASAADPETAGDAAETPEAADVIRGDESAKATPTAVEDGEEQST